MLSHPWLTMKDDYDYRMSEMEYKLHELKEQTYMTQNYNADPNFLIDYKNRFINPNTPH
jgi:hypothetical protein